MRDKVKITEYDIFQYVFFPREITEEKIKLIENTDKYSYEIGFYDDLKEELGRDLDYNIKRRLAELIPSYQMLEKIELFPDAGIIQDSTFDLLPDSGTKVLSFTDSQKKCFAKIVIKNESAEVYIFYTGKKELKNYCLVIYPEVVQYFIQSSKYPLRINTPEFIEKIILDFNYPD